MSADVKYIGVNDRISDLFEGQYIIPNGMSYNSYLIDDLKPAVFDTVDKLFVSQWINNIKNLLGDKTPEYLIIQHMEPDHSSGIAEFLKLYPGAKIVATDKAFVMMKKFYDITFSDNAVTVKDGDKLSLGNHELNFITAPMVHWPEVMMTYDSFDKILFSADAFGKFGTLDTDEDWACEARRYYFGIVGKYGVQVQNLLKKLDGKEIEKIYPLHGPMLCDNIRYYIDLYNVWSSYGVESEGVKIFYTSVYGNTKKAVEILKDELTSLGCVKVSVTDLAREDMAEAVEDAFKYGKIVLATTTYNADIFPFMREFLTQITERNFQNRTIGIIENGSWAPVAAKRIIKQLEECKNITYTDTVVTIHSAVKDENITQIKALAKEIL